MKNRIRESKQGDEGWEEHDITTETQKHAHAHAPSPLPLPRNDNNPKLTRLALSQRSTPTLLERIPADPNLRESTVLRSIIRPPAIKRTRLQGGRPGGWRQGAALQWETQLEVAVDRGGDVATTTSSLSVCQRHGEPRRLRLSYLLQQPFRHGSYCGRDVGDV